MVCTTPTDNVQPGASPNPIPGFGAPFSLPSSNTPPIPKSPEDLNSLFDALQFILPSGILKAPLSYNYDKTVYDVVLKLMEGFAPFLMMYKAFLPVLNIILCIIEIICAIPNPFKLIDKIQKLFRECIPQFLSLFPQFALIVIILSIISLLISLIDYVITEVTNLVTLIQNNINTIKRALSLADDRAILTATQKIGSVLCSFQNLFVLFSLFDTLTAVIQEILKLVFNIPPCSDSSSDSCCSPDVCPSFIKDNETITRSTGSLQYFNQVAIDSGLSLPAGFGAITFDLRSESWQFYDASAAQQLAFINITHPYDLPPGLNTIFFPTDANYTPNTPISQVPYLVDLRLFYNPANWGRTDLKGPRYIRINNCIVLKAPNTSLFGFDNSIASITNGVLDLAGGLAYEDDGNTPILINNVQATLNTFIHMSAEVGLIPPSFSQSDGYAFTNVTYNFKIQHPILLSKSLITLGCVPSVGFDRTFINTTFGNNINFALLNGLIFPDIAGAQLCMAAAVSGLQNNVSDEGLATFQSTVNACLSNLRSQAGSMIGSLVNIGFDANKSSFTITPKTQFTTQPIKVSVLLNEVNGLSLISGLASDVASTIADGIKATITFGEINNFAYDGYGAFIADLTSKIAGTGTIKVSYQNQTISTVVIPTDLTRAPSIKEVELPYTFIFSPVSSTTNKTGVGDSSGKPIRDLSDIAES